MTGERGFTLVEMLVALTVFALLAAAGVGILRASVDTQAAVEGRLADVSTVGRLQSVLSADLGQVVDRPSRGTTVDRPAFVGEAGRMAFVRAGWSNLDGAARPDLQRIEWQSSGGELVRSGYRTLDGDGAAAPAAFARDVTGATFRYRLADGGWQTAFQSDEANPLPVAVEVVLTRRGQAPLTLVFALPQAGFPRPAPPAEGGAA